MIPKQWFEEQGIEVKETFEDVSYYPTTTFTLSKDDRKVQIILEEYKKTTLIAKLKLFFYRILNKLQNTKLFYNFIKIEEYQLTLIQYWVIISFFEQEFQLLSYRADHFSSTNEKIKLSLIKWLINRTSVEDVHKYNGDIKVHTEFYQNYYLKYAEKALLIYEWDKLKKFINMFEQLKGDEILIKANILYDLCRNSPICSNFFCTGNAWQLIFIVNQEGLFYSIFIADVYLVRYDAKEKEFPTPQEAVAYLETLLAEHLKNT